MRITKKWLRERKVRFQEYVKSLMRLNHYQLKVMVKNTIPNALIHVHGCPNCGAEFDIGHYDCKCTPAERAMAAADQSERECIKVLLLNFIEEQIPSHLVD